MWRRQQTGLLERVSNALAVPFDIECAAVSKDGSNRCPLAVLCPASACPYHDANPASNTGPALPDGAGLTFTAATDAVATGATGTGVDALVAVATGGGGVASTGGPHPLAKVITATLRSPPRGLTPR